MDLILKAAVTERQYEKLAAMASSIWNECYSSLLTPSQIEYMLARFQSAEVIQEQIEQQGYRYYFIVANGQKVGYTALKIEFQALFLSKLYIQSEVRGKGYSKLVIGKLVAIANQAKLKSIWLTVNRYNEAAIAAYKRSGFVITDEKVADIGNGYVMDDYIMELALV